MSARRSAVAGWPLAALSIALIAMPSSWSQSPRLTLQAGLIPIKSTAAGLGAFMAHANPFTSMPPADELMRKLEFAESKNMEYLATIAKLKASNESLSGARVKIKDARLTLLPATVIVPTDSSTWRKSFVIARGSRDAVAIGMSVLWNNHLVGRVSAVAPWTSRVVLITDPEMRVGAAAVPGLSDKTQVTHRDIGVLEGTGEPTATLKWVSTDVTVSDGVTVVTTADPFRGVPEGLLLGRVTGLARTSGRYPRVQVEPFVNLRAIDSVLVLMKVDE